MRLRTRFLKVTWVAMPGKNRVTKNDVLGAEPRQWTRVHPALGAPNLTLCLRQPAFLFSALFSLSLEAPGAVMCLYKHREGG